MIIHKNVMDQSANQQSRSVDLSVSYPLTFFLSVYLFTYLSISSPCGVSVHRHSGLSHTYALFLSISFSLSTFFSLVLAFSHSVQTRTSRV